MLLDGIHVPLTTPFFADGRLNLRKLEYNVERYSRTPAAGMVALGVNGEATTLNDAETHEALRAAIGAAAAEKVMLAGVARDGVAGALEIADSVGALGYDGVVVGLPSMLAAVGERTGREALIYFQAIADRAAVPVVLVSSPARVLGVDWIVELAGHPRVLGMIESTGEDGVVAGIRERTAGVKRTATVTTVFAAVTGRMLARAQASVGVSAYIGAESLQGGGTAVAVGSPASVGLKTRVRETGFQVLAGTTAGMLAGLRAGANGAIPRMAACAPQACYEVFAGWKDGDDALAKEKQERVAQAALRIEEMGVAGLKYGCDLNGYFGGASRLPLLPCSGAEQLEIEDLLRGMTS